MFQGHTGCKRKRHIYYKENVQFSDFLFPEIFIYMYWYDFCFFFDISMNLDSITNLNLPKRLAS